MRLSMPTASDLAETFAEPWGLNLRITRKLTVPSGSPAMNSVYVIPPGGLSLDTRLFMSVTFDLPRAGGFPLEHGPFAEEVEVTRGRGVHGTFPGAAEPWESLPAGGSGPSPLGGRISVPEPWAVVLRVSPVDGLLSEDSTVNVTCQFNRASNGVRLNTPRAGARGALQTDKAQNLESPLDYGSYQSGYMARGNDLAGQDPVPGERGVPSPGDPPVFTLGHSFCGWNAAIGHTPGNGSLVIAREESEVRDHRVYSSNSLISAGPAQTSETRIRALGISLATLHGYGWMSVRLRTFSLSFNDSPSA
jgi:hypothetical protein